MGGRHPLHRAARLAWLLGGSLAAPVATAEAQGRAIPHRETSCNGQVIKGITIRSEAPTVSASRRIPVVGDIARAAHVNTRSEMIQRYLLLKEGDRCVELRRAESERILRAQPFIADAWIEVLQGEEPGVVELDVRTTDEASLVLGAQPGAGMPPLRQVRVGSGNLAGFGVYAAVDWRDSGPRRDQVGGRIVDNQFLGEPWVLSLSGRRTDRGGDWETVLARPFLTGLQRLAWHGGGGSSGGYVGLVHPDAPERAVRLDRRWVDAGAVGRIGPPEKLGLLGISLSHEEELTGRTTLLMRDSGLAPDPNPLLLPYGRLGSSRMNLFLGYRALHFVRVQGMDALSATQDLPVGVQLSGMAGRGVQALGASEDDRFYASDIAFGTGDERRATRGQLRWEGRSANRQFDDVLFSGRVAHYEKPNWRRTLMLAMEWGGGSRQRIPYQLRLGDTGAGVRGWQGTDFAGGWRGVVQLEDRHMVGYVGSAVETGWGWFVDVGRVWRGDAPIAVTTPIVGSAGISLLGSAPPGSARLWRVDLAVPMGPNAGHRVALVFSHGDRTRVFWREPGDVGMLHARSNASQLFEP